MICPYCLTDVISFTEQADAKKGIWYLCPQCHEKVPLRYVRDYHQYPPVIFSLVGMRGHGKTTYLASLLYDISRLGMRVPGFTYSALDEEAMVMVREKQRALEEGHLPTSTPQMFPRPVIIRLKGDNLLGQCHLLIYDTAGEVFNNVNSVKQFAGYIVRSDTIVWLLSEKDLAHPSDVDDFLTRILQAIEELRGNPKKQSLLIVLTKADIIATNNSPDGLFEFLHLPEEAALSGDKWISMSTAIEQWMVMKDNYVNFINRAHDEFHTVVFTAISALGAMPKGAELVVKALPRRVLSPCYSVWITSLIQYGQRNGIEPLREISMNTIIQNHMSIGMLGDKAKALYALGHWEEAEKCWRHHLATKPDDTDATVGCVKTLYARRKFQDALLHANEILQQYPRQIECLAIRALSLAAIGECEKSLQACNACLIIENHPSVHALKDELESSRKSIIGELEHKLASIKLEIASAEAILSAARNNYQSAIDVYERERTQILTQPPWRYAPTGIAAWMMTYVIWLIFASLILFVSPIGNIIHNTADPSLTLCGFIIVGIVACWLIMKIGLGTIIQRYRIIKMRIKIRPIMEIMERSNARLGGLLSICQEYEYQLTEMIETFNKQCINIPLDSIVK